MKLAWAALVSMPSGRGTIARRDRTSLVQDIAILAASRSAFFSPLMTSMPSLTRTSMSASSTPGNSAETFTSLSVSATSTWTPELSGNEPGQPEKGEKGTWTAGGNRRRHG